MTHWTENVRNKRVKLQKGFGSSLPRMSCNYKFTENALFYFIIFLLLINCIKKTDISIVDSEKNRHFDTGALDSQFSFYTCVTAREKLTREVDQESPLRMKRAKQ